MASNHANSEINLRLRQIDAQYSAMLTDVQAWIHHPEMNLWADDHTDKVASRMAVAEQLGRDAIQIYSSMSETERNSDDNRAQRAKIEVTMKELIQLLGQLGEAAQKAQTELMPQLRVEIEASRMISAYSSSQND